MVLDFVIDQWQLENAKYAFFGLRGRYMYTAILSFGAVPYMYSIHMIYKIQVHFQSFIKELDFLWIAIYIILLLL